MTTKEILRSVYGSSSYSNNIKDYGIVDHLDHIEMERSIYDETGVNVYNTHVKVSTVAELEALIEKNRC
ncbi:hypothetical protein HPMBJEAJ_00049 [Aeromonas phage avDM6]|nr:hypothetical protein HPMBJEAJ_00049 [Aeromonas phage avDM6]